MVMMKSRGRRKYLGKGGERVMSKDVAPSPPVDRAAPNDYVSNSEMLSEVIKSKQALKKSPGYPAGAMTRRLAEMFMLMVDKYGSKYNWSGYSYLDEMKSDALLNLCNKWDRFDETKYNNPFAFYTQIIYHCFLGSQGKEKKVQKIRDRVLMANGMKPSMSMQVDNDPSWQNLDEPKQSNPADWADEAKDPTEASDHLVEADATG